MNGMVSTKTDKIFYPGLSKILLFNLTTTSIKQLNGITMGLPIGYLMAHVMMNYVIDKALEIILLNKGRQLATRQQILSGRRCLRAQTYEMFADFKELVASRS